jgi:predicted Zn finger-like uncharacterized protein
VAAKEDSQVVVLCPKCKARLKVNETKLSPSGSRFKCPKCRAVLMVRKPASQPKKVLDSGKILVAHSNPEMLRNISSILSPLGCSVITASDGIDAVVKALKEHPFLTVMEVALPKIYGFEVCKRLKLRPETKNMKFLLVASVYDKKKYRREPVSLYGADDYIEEHDLPEQLLDKASRLREQPTTDRPRNDEVSRKPDGQQAAETGTESAAGEKVPSPDQVSPDEKIEKAKRLARTIINDIYLYNTAKLEDSLTSGNFHTVFASELREGQKLYDSRVSAETRAISDFFNEAIENFLAAKKKSLL